MALEKGLNSIPPLFQSKCSSLEMSSRESRCLQESHLLSQLSLLASSKFQTCWRWVRAQAATAASPAWEDDISARNTALCQEANPTVWVGAGVGLGRLLLPGKQLRWLPWEEPSPGKQESSFLSSSSHFPAV